MPHPTARCTNSRASTHEMTATFVCVVSLANYAPHPPAHFLSPDLNHHALLLMSQYPQHTNSALVLSREHLLLPLVRTSATPPLGNECSGPSSRTHQA